MPVNSVSNVNNTPVVKENYKSEPSQGIKNYYIQPKKTHAGKIITSAVGLVGTGALLPYVANELADELKQLGKNVTRVSAVSLGLGLVALCYGIGAVVDNIAHRTRVRHAEKKAIELYKQDFSANA